MHLVQTPEAPNIKPMTKVPPNKGTTQGLDNTLPRWKPVPGVSKEKNKITEIKREGKKGKTNDIFAGPSKNDSSKGRSHSQQNSNSQLADAQLPLKAPLLSSGVMMALSSLVKMGRARNLVRMSFSWLLVEAWLMASFSSMIQPQP